MIYEYALEPELVATWHERRVAHPFVSGMGYGHPRAPCAFPFPAWERAVLLALEGLFPDRTTGRWQSAKKNLEVLLRHIKEVGTLRRGASANQASWLALAEQEHAAFPFGGIVVRSGNAQAHLVVAADFGEADFPAWNRAAPPVTRQPAELAAALAPVLRCASEIRFVDPYFDAGVAEFFEPMRRFLEIAQRRRSPTELRVSFHVALTPPVLQQAQRIDPRIKNYQDLAELKFKDCGAKLKPLLQAGVEARFLAWSEAKEQLHNRYLLTNVGGVLLGSGLDANGRIRTATDDLAILPQEQFKVRWEQYSVSSTTLKLVLERPIL